MSAINLANAAETIDTSKDGLIILKVHDTLRGGKSLDVTGFPDDVIQAGHPIIRETATGELKPMPVSGSALAALPAGHTYFGILIASITKVKPFAAVLLRGTVNPTPMKYSISGIQAAFTAAVPHILFQSDL